MAAMLPVLVLFSIEMEEVGGQNTRYSNSVCIVLSHGNRYRMTGIDAFRKSLMPAIPRAEDANR